MDETNYDIHDPDQSGPQKPVLDTLIQSRDLQMLKSVVPYLNSSQQRMISLVIRLVELQKTIQLFDNDSGMQAAELHICENDTPAERARHILNAVREYCTPTEQENIDTVLNFFDMYNSYESLFSEGGLPDLQSC